MRKLNERELVSVNGGNGCINGIIGGAIGGGFTEAAAFCKD